MVKDLQFETLKKSRSRKSVTPHLVISWWIHSLELPPPQDPRMQNPVTTRIMNNFFGSGIPSKTFICDDCILAGGGETKSISWLYYVGLLSYPFYLGKNHWFVPFACLIRSHPLFFLGWLLGTAGQLARILDPILQVFGVFFGESKNPQGTMPFSTTKNQRRNWGGWEVFRIYLFLL